MLVLVQLTGSQADLVAAASSGNLQALNSMSTGNLAGLTGDAGISQSQVNHTAHVSLAMLFSTLHRKLGTAVHHCALQHNFCCAALLACCVCCACLQPFLAHSMSCLGCYTCVLIVYQRSSNLLNSLRCCVRFASYGCCSMFACNKHYAEYRVRAPYCEKHASVVSVFAAVATRHCVLIRAMVLQIASQ